MFDFPKQNNSVTILKHTQKQVMALLKLSMNVGSEKYLKVQVFFSEEHCFNPNK